MLRNFSTFITTFAQSWFLCFSDTLMLIVSVIMNVRLDSSLHCSIPIANLKLIIWQNKFLVLHRYNVPHCITFKPWGIRSWLGSLSLLHFHSDSLHFRCGMVWRIFGYLSIRLATSCKTNTSSFVAGVRWITGQSSNELCCRNSLPFCCQVKNKNDKIFRIFDNNENLNHMILWEGNKLRDEMASRVIARSRIIIKQRRYIRLGRRYILSFDLVSCGSPRPLGLF